jgi:hypothetical protein
MLDLQPKLRSAGRFIRLPQVPELLRCDRRAFNHGHDGPDEADSDGRGPAGQESAENSDRWEMTENREFVCSVCGEQFFGKRTDAECRDEHREVFGFEVRDSDLAVVCEDCFNRLIDGGFKDFVREEEQRRKVIEGK